MSRISQRAALRGAALAAVVLAPTVSAAAFAGAVWDFYGGVNASAGRSDNPRFVSRTNPNFDPNAPVCALPPSDPNYDAGVCSPHLPPSERRGDLSGSLRLTGGVSASWSTTRFDAAYSPDARFYYDLTHLNQVSHNLASSWRHEYSPRTSLQMTEYLNYTPEQDPDPNNLQQNAVLVKRTTRTNSTFRSQYRFQKSRTSDWTWSYHWTERAFSSEDYIDSSDHGAGLQWRRRLGERNYVSTGYDFGIFSFKGRSPGAEHHSAHVGYGYETPRGFGLNLGAGYNILLPDASNENSSGGYTINSSVAYNGVRAAATLGHTRGITDGGGAFPNAETNNTYANVRLNLTKALSADLVGTHNVHQRILTGAATAGDEETVRSLSGRGSMTYRFSRDWAVSGSYGYYRQSISGSNTGGQLPDVRSGRYAVGVSWSIR